MPSVDVQSVYRISGSLVRQKSRFEHILDMLPRSGSCMAPNSSGLVFTILHSMFLSIKSLLQMSVELKIVQQWIIPLIINKVHVSYIIK